MSRSQLIVLLCGVVFGINSLLAGAQSAGDSVSASGQDAASKNVKPAPINPYNGMQEREEVFAFTQKPSVKKEGDKWVITFTSKANCDATVTILDKDGKVVRHLASGVLGKNAPWPFQQNTLSQKVEWDGTKDDFSKADPAGCRVRLSLGLKPVFERNISWDPYDVPPCIGVGIKENMFYIVGQTADGGRVVGGHVGSCVTARLYDKNWKYVKTVYPPPADEIEEYCAKRKVKLATTKWGDKVPVLDHFTGGFDPKKGGLDRCPELVEVMKWFGESKDLVTISVAEAGMPRTGLPVDPKALLYPKTFAKPPIDLFSADGNHRIAVDASRDLLYVNARGSNLSLRRIDGQTGVYDENWFPAGDGPNSTEYDVGPDGCLYVRAGHEQWLYRVDMDGKVVPFQHNAESVKTAFTKSKAEKGRVDGPPKHAADLEAIYTGAAESSSQVHEKGFDVSVNGRILTIVETIPEQKKSGEWMQKNGLPLQRGYYVVVWDRDGRVLSSDAIEGNIFGHGVRMDRDGNIYRRLGGILPFGQKHFDGIADVEIKGSWAGYASIVKFQGQGDYYPVGQLHVNAERSRVPYVEGKVPTDALKLHFGNGRAPAAAAGGLWAYGALSADSTRGDCSCWHYRFDLDGWGRSWNPSLPCKAVMVVDANGNRILRAGRYGNVDDTEADVKAGKDGLRFTCPLAVAVSDTAMYVRDIDNRRILKAALKYAAEETAALP